MTFVIRGPVEPGCTAAVRRRAALDAIHGWLSQAGAVGVVLGARQTGKTSLYFQLRDELSDDHALAYVDFQQFHGATWDECVGHIAETLVDKLLPDADDFSDIPARAARFPKFLKALSRRIDAARIAIVFEELGGLPDACRHRLGQMIRAVFTERLHEPAYKRYVFLVFGAHEMRDIAGTRNSPLWNVAEKLYLGEFDFSPAEIADLVRAATALGDEPAQRMGALIHDWSRGHPYWAQRLAMELCDRCLATDAEFRDLDAATGVIHELIQTEDTNLPHLVELLDTDDGGDAAWSLLDQILTRSVAFTRSNRAIATLELIGVIGNADGACHIRNPIYQRAIAQRLRKTQAQPRDPGASPMSRDGNGRVFISYTHDSDEHRRNILNLAQKLRDDGVDCTIDQFVNGSPAEGWPLWMERQLDRAEFVLVVCTETYLRRYKAEELPGRGLGATWEACLTRQELYECQASNTKFVPILLDGSTPEHIPTAMRPYTYHMLPDGYEGLLRYLTDQPAVTPRPLGPKKKLPPTR